MAELFVLSGVASGTVVQLPASGALVGRTPECQIVLGDPWISSRHAKFERRGEADWLVDLNSRNGTFVDDAPVKEVELRDGAFIKFGRTEVAYRASSSSATFSGVAPGRTLGSTAPMQTVSREPAYVSGAGIRELGIVNDFARLVMQGGDLTGMLQSFFPRLAEALTFEHASLLLPDADGAMKARLHHPANSPVRFTGQLVRAAMAQREPLITVDGMASAAVETTQAAPNGKKYAVVCTPIWGDGRLWGLLGLARDARQPFSPTELDVAVGLTNQLALGIERQRLLGKIETEEEQRKKLLRHISPDVASVILSKEGANGDPMAVSVRDDVTILFSDIRGFTTLTERLPPMELANLLKAYFSAMTEAIFAEAGTLDKFIGDGIMATFGAPVPQRNAAIRAVRCAWNMLERLERLNATFPDDRKLTIRIGINTGRVIAGTIGTPSRMEFTVLGDSVNTASRLESIAQPGTIAVGRSTMEKATAQFEFQPLGLKQVKGKQLQVEVFQVTGKKA